MADQFGERTAPSSAQARVAALQHQLVEQVEALQSGEQWREFLAFAARFHRYSAGNIILIRSAHLAAYDAGKVPSPNPTYVAGFQAWRLMGRAVERGQRGYPILAPAPYRQRLAVSGEGPDASRRRLARDEEPGPNERLIVEKRMGWRIEHVFDVSQTTGKPLPEFATPSPPLQGHAPPGLVGELTRFASARGFTVQPATPEELGSADGITNYADRVIKLREDLEPAGYAATLAHEIGHVVLHDPTDENGRGMHRGIREVEAESVAYVLAAAHGLDTGGDSLRYVSGWAGGDKPAKTVKATAERVITAAHEVLSALDTVQFGDGQPPGLATALAYRRTGTLAHDEIAPAPVPALEK